jgi:hypothetical protein
MVDSGNSQLDPDWPQIRRLVAKKLEKAEEEVQAMRDKGDSLEKVELLMLIEEVLGE